MGINTYDGNLTRTSDREWYARTRFRPDFEFAVGRVRAVLGIEIDLMYGQAGANDGGFPANVSGTNSGCKVNTNGCLDLNSDVGGMLEVKWIYTEFPLTGKDSLLPFIPIETMARAGAQPFDTLAQYKLAQYANGDFAGISAITTITPNLKSNLAWAIIEDQLAGSNRGNPSLRTGRGEDYALIASVDITPTKGIDLKPLYSWFHADGQTAGAARRNLFNPMTAGGQLNAVAARGRPTNPRPPVTPRSTKTATPSASTRACGLVRSASIPRSTSSGVGSTRRPSTTGRGRTAWARRRSRPTSRRSTST